MGTDTVTGSTIDGSVFTLTLDSGTDNYQFNLIQPIDDGAGAIPINLDGLSNSSNTFKALSLGSDGNEGIIFSGYIQNGDGSITQSTVNPSGQGGSVDSIGVANQSMNDGNVLGIDFVTDAFTGKSAADEYFNYTTHFDINNFSFQIVQNSGSVLVRAFDVVDDDPTSFSETDHFNAISSGLVLDVITSIQINGISVALTSADVYAEDGGYVIRGLSLSDKVTVGTSDGYSRLEIENPSSVTGDTYDIGTFSYEIVNTGAQTELSFGTTLTDGDGDTSGGTIAVSIDPEAANSTIIGGDGGDIILGGAGSDALAGSSGADTFVYSEGDGGSSLALADLITGFEDGVDSIGLDGLVYGVGDGEVSFVTANVVEGDGSVSDTALVINQGAGYSEILAVIEGVTGLDGSDIS